MLEAITVSWNVIGTVDLSIAAIGARSVALAGLGSTASLRSERRWSCRGSSRGLGRHRVDLGHRGRDVSARQREGAHRHALRNPVLQTESRVTAIDEVLAVAALAALVLNSALGWWWADPTAAYVLV